MDGGGVHGHNTKGFIVNGEAYKGNEGEKGVHVEISIR